MNVLLVCVLVVVLYIAWLNERIRAAVNELIAKLEKEKSNTERPNESRQKEVLGYEWFEDGWPYPPDEDDRKANFRNPEPFRNRDDYSDGLLLAEYDSATSAAERKRTLAKIFRSGVEVPWELAEKAFHGELSVRIWAAAHLPLIKEDFTDYRNPTVIKDFETPLRSDPSALVRAAVLSNPDCSLLPWRSFSLKAGWQAMVAAMTQLERLAMMRNTDLLPQFVVALLAEPSANLEMTRQEHGYMICAAVENPRIISASRRTGRDFWWAGGDVSPASKEFGEIWHLASKHWLDGEAWVAYRVFEYVQTTADIKLETYTLLLKQTSEGSNATLRQAILGSCEPRKDREVLRLGWKDPDEYCRETAKDRTEDFTAWVGVK